ncbi:MAG: hypothetical protein V4640_15865 [Verrucomicrobiota bacterium]
MIAARHGIFCIASALCLASVASARQIDWFCLPNKINRVSTGGLMDASFLFQLGVFKNGFIPKASNIADWSKHWETAQDSSYNTVEASFANNLVVATSPPASPFTVGAKAYVWGRGNGGEWILFRNTAWTWPAEGNPMDFPLDWNAADTNEVILGEIPSTGIPFQMKSAAVLSYQAWRDVALAGEPLHAPGDDPDQDGSSNALEFVFGTSPVLAGSPTLTPLSIVDASDLFYQQITVPRLRDRLATVVVEVSGDLVTWQSGAAHTLEVSNSDTQLVVRDVVPTGPSNPRRFMRARVVVTP